HQLPDHDPGRGRRGSVRRPGAVPGERRGERRRRAAPVRAAGGDRRGHRALPRPRVRDGHRSHAGAIRPRDDRSDGRRPGAARARRMSVVALAGGVGGAKLAEGLQAVLGAELNVIVNTADDTERHGLLVCADHDTVMYTLAGLENPEFGWGIAGDTWTTMHALERYGEEGWFRLGDQDLATHIVRTERLRRGERLTAVCRELQSRLGVRAPILPMTDDPVRTQVRTDDGWLDFQDYFVRLRQAPDVREVRFVGIEAARPTPEVEATIDAATAIVVAPSNPIVTVGPILAVPGIAQQLAAARARGTRIAAG